jgi:hypothetical protein
MLPWVFVRATPSGPVPIVAHAVAGVTPVTWYGSGLQGRRVRYVYRLEGVSGHGVVVVTRG